MARRTAPGAVVKVVTSGWKRIGASANADFFEIEPHVLAVVPHEAVTDDEATARESVTIQLEYLRRNGTRAGVVVFMDPVIEQTAAARNVYRTLPDPAFQACYALVGGTTFGRAVGSIFIGIHPPRVPTRLFGTFDEAMAWVRQVVGFT